MAGNVKEGGQLQGRIRVTEMQRETKGERNKNEG